MKLRTLTLAFGAGAATMYLLDRDHGAERRRQLTDKAEGLLGSTGEAVDEARQLGVEAARVGYDARDAVAEVAGAVTDGPPSKSGSPGPPSESGSPGPPSESGSPGPPSESGSPGPPSKSGSPNPTPGA